MKGLFFFLLFLETPLSFVVGNKGGWLSCRMENKAVRAASGRSSGVQPKVAGAKKIAWENRIEAS